MSTHFTDQLSSLPAQHAHLDLGSIELPVAQASRLCPHPKKHSRDGCATRYSKLPLLPLTLLPLILVLFAYSGALAAPPGDSLHLLSRSRTEIAPKSGQFQVIEQAVDLDPKQTALIICDLWDKHWCDGATSASA